MKTENQQRQGVGASATCLLSGAQAHEAVRKREVLSVHVLSLPASRVTPSAPLGARLPSRRPRAACQSGAHTHAAHPVAHCPMEGQGRADVPNAEPHGRPLQRLQCVAG